MSSSTMLRHVAFAILATAMMFFATDARSQGAIPRTLSYQGVLLDSTGIAVCDSTWDIAFSLYRQSVGGHPVWIEQHSVRTKLGVFGVVLGQQTPLSISHGDSLWLSIKVGTAEPLASRVQLTAVPYALSADSSTYAFVAGSAHTLSSEGADALRKSIGLPENKMGDVLIGAINLTGTSKIDPKHIPPVLSRAGSNVHAYGPIDSVLLAIGKGVVGSDELEDVFTTKPSVFGGPTQSLIIEVDVDGRVRSIRGVEITGVLPGGEASGDLRGTYPAPLIRDSAVTRDKLRNAAVSTEKLVDASVTHSKLADNSVGTDNIIDQAVTTPKLADSAVTTDKMANEAVTKEKLARYSVTEEKILDHQVTSDKMTNMPLAPGTYGNSTQVAQVYVDQAGRVVTVRNVDIVSVPPAGPAGGDLTGVYPNPQIRDSAVTRAKVATNAITSQNIVDGEVRTGDIADHAVTTSKIGNEQVTTEKLRPTGVVPGVYGGQQYSTVFSVDTSGRVTTATTVAITGVSPGGAAGGDLTGSYPNPSVAPSAITSAKIADGTIATADIANNAVTTAKMSTTGVTAGSYGTTTQVPAITVDASGRLTSAGNVTISGTTPGGPAGGVLAGTYPNPSLAPGAITTSSLSDSSITTAKLSNTSVVPGTYGSSTQVGRFTVDQKGRLQYAGNVLITGTTPGGTAGGVLAGTYPNPSLAPGVITTATISDSSITTAKLSNTTVVPGTYGSSTQVGQFTVDQKGRLQYAGNVTISGTTPGGLAGGDLTGTYPNPSVAPSAITSAKIADGTIATLDIANNAVTSGKMSTTGVTTGSYGSATQVATFTVDAAGRLTAAGSTTISGTTPGGPAGGVLAGTYPNPSLAPGVITTATISDSSITTEKLSSTTVVPGTYGSSTQVGQFTVDQKGRLQYAGNVLITGTTPGGAASGDLTGSYPNPSVAPSAITSAKIADGTIATADIANNAVTTAKMSTTGVTAGSYGTTTQVPAITVDASGRLTSAGNVTISGTTPGGPAGGVLAGTYPNPSLAPGAITTSSLSDSSITTAKLSNTAVVPGTYGSSTQVGQFTVDQKGRLQYAGNVLISGTTPGGIAGGDLTGTYPNPSVAPSAITSAKIADGTIATADIANNAVTTAKMSTTGVTAASYGSATQVATFTVDAAGRLTAAGNTTITGTTPGGSAGGDLTGTYPSPSVASLAITTSKLANDAVTSGKIADGTIATADVADNAITSGKMTTTGVAAGSYGSTTQVGTFTVDAAGRITAAGNVTISGAAPGGTAGGDLTGTYPNPSVAALAIGTTKLANDAVTSGKIADGTIATADVADNAITSGKMSTTGVTAASYGSATQVATFTVDAAGRLTAAGNTTITGTTPGGTAGGDLTGTYPNPTVAASAITTSKLANDAVTSGKIADGTISTVDIADAAVTSAKLANTAVTPGTYGTGLAVSQITVDQQGRITSATNVPIIGAPPSGSAGGDLTGSYPNPTVAADAITSAKIANGTIATVDVADNAITSGKMSTTGVAAASYGSATQVATFTVDGAGRLTAAGNTTITGTTPGGTAGGDLTGTYPNPTVAASAITTSKLANDAVTSGKIADGTIVTADVADNAITSAKMSTTGVAAASYGSATQVATFTVDAAGRLTAAGNTTITGTTPGGTAGGDLTGTYPNPSVAALAIGTTKLANDAVTSGKIADGTIATADVADNAITSAKMSTTGVTAASYGTATQVPAITVDAAGRITSAGSVTISGVAPGGTANGDLAGSYPNPTVDGLQGRTVAATAPAAGNVLMWNATTSQWEPTAPSTYTLTIGGKQVTDPMTVADGDALIYDAVTDKWIARTPTVEVLKLRLKEGTNFDVDVLRGATTEINDITLSENAFFTFVNASANCDITGFANGEDGRMLIIVNHSGKNLTFQDEDTGSLANNRLSLGVANKTISNHQSIMFVYSADVNRWVLLANT